MTDVKTYFSNFRYNSRTDDIEWTNDIQINTDQFPLEGMVTRYLHKANRIYGMELSTPSLKGHSGGPVFNSRGLVCGMSFGTALLKYEYNFKESEYDFSTGDTVNNHPAFMYSGYCIHADVIKEFLLRARGLEGEKRGMGEWENV